MDDQCSEKQSSQQETSVKEFWVEPSTSHAKRQRAILINEWFFFELVVLLVEKQRYEKGS